MNTTFDSKTIVMMAENGHSVEIDGKRIQMTIVTDAQASEAQPDYSHLVGKFVKCLEDTLDGHAKDYLYPVVDVQGYLIFIENENQQPMSWNTKLDSIRKYFDLSNPLDHNPDDVRVFDVPSEIKISKDSDGLNLHFSEYQCLWYDKKCACYGVSVECIPLPHIPCIATECKFEDLNEGDLFFATDRDEPDLLNIDRYNFLDNNDLFVWINNSSVIVSVNSYNHYFKITPKP